MIEFATKMSSDATIASKSIGGNALTCFGNSVSKINIPVGAAITNPL